MAHPPYWDVEGWLDAESAGRADEADVLFAAMFSRRVPRLSPAPGFAGGVLAALQRPLAASRGLAVPRWGRAAVFVLLTFGGLAAALLASTPVFELVAGAGIVLSRAVRLASAVSGAWWGTASHGWSATLALGRAIALVGASGPAIAVVAANLTLALVASIGLKRLLSPEEESS